MFPPIHTLLDGMKIDAGSPESVIYAEVLARSKAANFQLAAVDPLPLSEEAWICSEDDSSQSEEDSVDGEELETFSLILAPIPKYADAEETVKRRARALVQEAWSMNFVWEFPEIRNDDAQSEVFPEGMELPPPLIECTELDKEEVHSESSDREGRMLENHVDSNTAPKQTQKVFE